MTTTVPVPPALLGFCKAAYAQGLSARETTLALRPFILDGQLQSAEFRAGLKDELVKNADAMKGLTLAELGHVEFADLPDLRRL